MLLWLSLKRGFGGCRHGFGGCDGLGRLNGFGEFDGLGGFGRCLASEVAIVCFFINFLTKYARVLKIACHYTIFFQIFFQQLDAGGKDIGR